MAKNVSRIIKPLQSHPVLQIEASRFTKGLLPGNWIEQHHVGGLSGHPCAIRRYGLLMSSVIAGEAAG
jgi:hypothetical protein